MDDMIDFPNGIPSPEEQEEIKRRMWPRIKNRFEMIEWEMNNRNLTYLMGLREHYPGDADVMEN